MGFFETVRVVLFLQHPYTLLFLGGLFAVVLFFAAIVVGRVVAYVRWRRDAPGREALLLASVSGLSADGRQGRGGPSLGGYVDGLPLPSRPPADVPPIPPYSPFEAYRDADGYLRVEDMAPCDEARFYGYDDEPSSRSGT
ncbi:hypothetical protein [Pseudoxanthomonas sp. PXM04]|uniref:hypothetical protein n=1 Tax=Pseudoxanthomonas sp. PXM04 TaxID=2769297 RepID=UPI00178299F7|nr:hypothetical protein [Pseudoxanthomonas sp. PXM04]MBD9377925.1 hypothetical protein [Pseudoxanthomonas sp. PXM04]